MTSSMRIVREAMIEKKMARREAAKEREASPDLIKLPGGGDIFGGDDSLEAAKARWAVSFNPWNPRCDHSCCSQSLLCTDIAL